MGESAPDLSFDGHWRAYATHGIHPFPAKFPPALARWAIEQFTQPGEWLLDPFVGSGTSLVEARLLGRNALAAEIDPLARLMTQVKATPLDPAKVALAKEQIDQRWSAYTEALAHHQTFPLSALPEFPRRDYWFHEHVQHDLVVLRDAIATLEEAAVRDFFLVVYSSIIIAKGPSSVANALDIAHSRGHHIDRPEPPNVWARFCDRYKRAFVGLQEFYARADQSVRTLLLGTDARNLPYEHQLADLIFTSPPYVTAIEYPRSHKFSVWWIGELLGVPNTVYDHLGREYIGTGSVPSHERAALQNTLTGLPTPDRITRALDEIDRIRAGQARRYFSDMRSALAEMLRTLKSGRYAVLVVADANLRGITVPTGTCLVEIAESLAIDGARFVHRDTLIRTIRERSRQMPIKRGNNAEAMKTEEIIILQRCPTQHRSPGSSARSEQKNLQNGHIQIQA